MRPMMVSMMNAICWDLGNPSAIFKAQYPKEALFQIEVSSSERPNIDLEKLILSTDPINLLFLHGNCTISTIYGC